eukprot:3166570-Amphidinium_carterae.1
MALDSQSKQTLDEDPRNDMEGTPLPSAMDSQSHTTTASYMSDVDSCSGGLQHGSDMQVCDVAISTGENAEMDNNDPLGLLQSQSPPSQRRSRRARSSPPVRGWVRLVSCERGESTEVSDDRPPSPRRRVPPPPPAPLGGRRNETPVEKQMPVPPVRR